jgi:hypothetical protein
MAANLDGAGRKAWLDDRDGHELFANLRDVVAAKLDAPVPPA